MLFGIVCVVVSVIALVIAIINGRAADDSLALPMLAVFLIGLIAGIISMIFDSWIAGVIVIVAIAVWLCNLIWP